MSLNDPMFQDLRARIQSMSALCGVYAYIFIIIVQEPCSLQFRCAMTLVIEFTIFVIEINIVRVEMDAHVS